MATRRSIAKFLGEPFGHASISSITSAATDEDFDYGWEERWIRDEGYSKIVPAAIKALLEKTGVAGADIAHLILPCPFAKLDQTLAKRAGIDPAKVRDNLAGDMSAMPARRTRC